jgi:hypothetical protein
MWRWQYLILLISGVLALAACQPAGLEITGASIVSVDAHSAAEHSAHGGAASSNPASAYFVMRNNTAQADRLLSVSTEIAQTAELHATTIENNVATMGPVAGIDVPANSAVELKPGGYHVMLLSLTRSLRVGEKIPLKLQFEKAGEITVEAEVRQP